MARVHARRPRQHLRRQSARRGGRRGGARRCSKRAPDASARAVHGDVSAGASCARSTHPAIVDVRGKGLFDRRRDRSGVRERAPGLRGAAGARRADEGHARHRRPLRAAADRSSASRSTRRRGARRDARARSPADAAEASSRRRRQRSASCATTPAKTAKPSQWLSRKARKQPSRVRVADQRVVPARDQRRGARPAKYGQPQAEPRAERAQIAR